MDFILGINLKTVNCKMTWEGTYSFTYEVDYGGGGICNSTGSAVVACQEPGSVYVDNQVFTMYFGKCPTVTTSMNQSELQFVQHFVFHVLSVILHYSCVKLHCYNCRIDHLTF